MFLGREINASDKNEGNFKILTVRMSTPLAKGCATTSSL
jgi:hypothetical protein